MRSFARASAFANLGIKTDRKGKGVQARNPGPMAWFNLGSFYYSMGRLKEARPALEKAVGLSPSMIEPRYDLAGIYHKSGEYQKSIVQLRKIIGIAPDSPVGQRAKRDLRRLGG